MQSPAGYSLSAPVFCETMLSQRSSRYGFRQWAHATDQLHFSMVFVARVSDACNIGIVKMSHVDDAINEMFQATHMQMMRNCCRLEKMLLASILMESRAKGQYMFAHPRLPSVQQVACIRHKVLKQLLYCAPDASAAAISMYLKLHWLSSSWYRVELSVTV